MAPKYDYRCVRCHYVMESEIRESLIWSCPVCVEDPHLEYDVRHQPMKRYYSVAPNMARVWNGDVYNVATGDYPTDYKKWRNTLADNGKRRTDRTGILHSYAEADHSDVKTLGVTEEGMDATHRRHRELGWTEAKSSTHIIPGKINGADSNKQQSSG